ncbi:MAG TPA: hypothetical protein VG032_01175 [Acidimicrobiales bacterium]|nr:hypothetical protein [Acidimicrobiales bacterium]
MPLLRRSRLPSLPRVKPTKMEVFGGWGDDFEDPVKAEAAVVYGQWADRLFLSVACLFLLPALADLGLWAASRSVASLLGPGLMLILCMVYLYRRRRFRQQVRRDPERAGRQVGAA